MPPLDEAAALHDFQELAKDPQPVELFLTKMQAWQLASTIQFATRHPGFNSQTSQTAVAVREVAREVFAQICTTPALKQLAEMGWDPQHDRPRGARSAAEADPVRPFKGTV